MLLAKENKKTFSEEAGLRLLEAFLESKQRIKTRFFRNDKTPIYDGSFNLLKGGYITNPETGKEEFDTSILREFKVQVKSKEEIKKITTGPNKGKYHCEFDVRVFNSIKIKTFDTCILYFFVDYTNERFFVKKIDIDFLVELNYNDDLEFISYYLTDADVITDVEKFYTYLDKIYDKLIEEEPFINEAKRIEIEKAMKSFYDKINDLKFIRDTIWPNFWKFGVRFSPNESIKITNPKTGLSQSLQANLFAIYPIEIGTKTNEIKKFKMDTENIFNTIDTVRETTPESYLNDCLGKLIYQYFDGDDFLEYVPNICLEEVIFHGLDELTTFDNTLESQNQYRTFNKDEISIIDLEKILEPYFMYFDCVTEKQIDQLPIDGVTKKLLRLNDYDTFAMLQFISNLKFVVSLAKKRSIDKFYRVWDFYVDKKDIKYPMPKTSFLNKDKIYECADKFFKLLPSVIDEAFENIPIKLKHEEKGTIKYSVEYIDYPEYPYYKLETIHVENDEKLTFIKSDIKSEKASLISIKKAFNGTNSIKFEEMFAFGTPLLFSVKSKVYKRICEKYNLNFELLSYADSTKSVDF